MTDDLAALDARGLAAGRRLRAAAAVHPVPVFDPDLLPLRVPVDGPVRRSGGRTGGSDGSADPADPPGPGRRRWIALVGVAAALALLAGVVLRAGGGDDGSAPVDDVEVRPRRVAAYVADPPPAGLDLVALVEPRPDEEPFLPGGGGGDPTGPTGPTATVYGPVATGRPGLAVVWVDAWAGGGTVPGPQGNGPQPTEAAGLLPVDSGVGGRRAWVTPTTWRGAPSVLVEVDGGFAQVHRAGDATQGDGTGPQSGATVDDALVSAAAAVVADPEARRATIDPEGLPTGWSEQGEVDTAAVVAGSVVGRASGGTVDDGYLAVYGASLLELDVEAPGDDVRGAVVSVAPGTEADLAGRRFWAPWYVEAEVQGHPALVVTLLEGGPGEVVVTWLDRPGVLVEVAVAGLTGEEALALARRVRPATTAEVDGARSASLEEELAGAAGERTVVGRGRFSDGRGWGLAVHGGEGIADGAELLVGGPPGSWACAAQGDGQVSAGPDAPVVGTTCRGTSGDLAAAYGRVRADVAEIALVDLDAEGGSAEVDRTAALVADGLAGFVVEVPEPDHRYRVVALDADGERLGSARLGVS